MNFAQAQARVNIGVLRADLQPNYGQYINEAIWEIENRRNWTFMKVTANPVILPASIGENFVQLPTNFKCLQRKTPVYLITEYEEQFIPCAVVFEAQQLRVRAQFVRWKYMGWPPTVYVERRADPMTNQAIAVLGVVDTRERDLNFRVDYYGHTAPMVNPTDMSPFLTDYPVMVIAKAKAIAFEDINDGDAAAGQEALYELRLGEAIRQDAYAEVAGHRTRM